MAEQPGFWSAEGFPYPLLALGQTFPKGYQYQSQMTPYKRDARGDWGRALNESMDQFFAMWPQYMQQKRQFALQRNQLERQRMSDRHQAKLRPFELRKMKAEEDIRANRMKMLKNYPTMVESLPVSEKIKAHLLTLPPTEGLDRMKTIMTHQFKPKTRLIKKGQPDSRGVIRRLDVQEKPDGTIIKAAVSPEKINVSPNEFFPGTERRNTSGVTIEYNPADGSFSYPLDKPPTRKKIVSVPTNYPGLSAFPKEVWPFLKLDKTHSEEGILIIDPAAKSMPQNLVAVKANDPLLANFPKEAWPYLKKDMSPGADGQLVLDPAYKLPSQFLVDVDKNDPRLKNYPVEMRRHLKLNKQLDQIVVDPAYSTAPKKRLVEVPKGDPRLKVYPEEMWPFFKLDKTHSEEGVLVLDEAAKSIPKNLVAVKANDPKLKAFPADMHPFLRKDISPGAGGQLVLDPAYSKEMQKVATAKEAPTPSQLFQAKHAANRFVNIKAFADLAEVAGNRIESQKNFVLTNLPKTHPLWQRAQDDRNLKFVEMGPNGVLISEGHKKDYNQPGRKAFTSKAPKTIYVEQGDTLDKIIARFKAEGITVDPTQVIAANQHFFLDDQGFRDPDKMLTSEQVGGAEMIIPVGGGSLNDFQIGEAHRSDSPLGSARQRTVVMDGIGTLHIFKNATIKEELTLNKKLGQMKILQSNVDEMLALLYDKEARNWFKLSSEARGKVNAIRWRLVNNIQTLREFGVLTPGEILVIEESVPNMNSFLNLIASDFVGLAGGSERFIEGALGALKSEGKTAENAVRAYMSAYDIPEIGFEIDIYNPPSSVDQGEGSESKRFVDQFRE